VQVDTHTEKLAQRCHFRCGLFRHVCGSLAQLQLSVCQQGHADSTCSHLQVLDTTYWIVLVVCLTVGFCGYAQFGNSTLEEVTVRAPRLRAWRCSRGPVQSQQEIA
jgi:hypothetical protein